MAKERWELALTLVLLALATGQNQVAQSTCAGHYDECIKKTTQTWKEGTKNKDKLRKICLAHEEPETGVWACVVKKLFSEDGITADGDNWGLLDAKFVGDWCLNHTVPGTDGNQDEFVKAVRAYSFLCGMHLGQDHLDNFDDCLKNKKEACVENFNYDVCRLPCDGPEPAAFELSQCGRTYEKCLASLKDLHSETRDWSQAMENSTSLIHFCEDHEKPDPKEGVWSCMRSKLRAKGLRVDRGREPNWMLETNVGLWCLQRLDDNKSEFYQNFTHVVFIYDKLCGLHLGEITAPNFERCLESWKDSCVYNYDISLCAEPCVTAVIPPTLKPAPTTTSTTKPTPDATAPTPSPTTTTSSSSTPTPIPTTPTPSPPTTTPPTPPTPPPPPPPPTPPPPSPTSRTPAPATTPSTTQKKESVEETTEPVETTTTTEPVVTEKLPNWWEYVKAGADIPAESVLLNALVSALFFFLHHP